MHLSHSLRRAAAGFLGSFGALLILHAFLG
jgi:hypothetical protein